ncbi:peptidyl-prolyl cis-trans isomerase B (cyclophilin B) [Pelagirhabdus alkalitolerans]|uniref:Peptidyl-prolyl cis-trans isomerase n=1 Tax=Pelagirhabdus alkalitolerans TaxID=1612202 RepID=A0A1G6H639_9BACI|nr:peptidylprolyl isomerase [Pelagirhabdus alkalitolerans]SDB89681.1 peptidyl-prolyl cis-trans isomerase B (cyclophilin B) [Pelagirhabdus alkalitolerans]
MNEKIKNILYVLILLLAISYMSGCEQSDTYQDVYSDESEESRESHDFSDVTENPIATIELANEKTVDIELYPEKAPNTVANFISLIESEFYDGLNFHRTIPGLLIQGGDPYGNGLGGPDYSIEGEFDHNGFDNPITHERGVISMARSQSFNSAGSQFFITLSHEPDFDGQYAGFGQVIDGIEHVDTIANSKTDNSDNPINEVIIERMTIDTKGYVYPEPIHY